MAKEIINLSNEYEIECWRPKKSIKKITFAQQ